MANIAIIMGSVYGAAQTLADTVSSALKELGHTVTYNTSPLVTDIHDVDASLVITSTTGKGDIPSNIEGFFLSAHQSKPMQHGKPFGVICLGDSSYQTFCGAGDKLEALFFDLKAHAPIPMLKIDACETLEPETKALPWLKNWLTNI
jgi:MioC protein